MSSIAVKKAVKQKDFWTSLIIIGFGIFLFSQIHSEENIHEVFPKIVCGSMIAVGLLQLLSALRVKTSESVNTFKISLLEIVFIIVLIATITLIDILGFYVSAMLCSVTLLLLLFRQRTIKVVLSSVLYSAVLLGVVYVVFTIGLKIKLPAGLLF